MFRKSFLWKLFTVFLRDEGDSQVQRWSLSSDKLTKTLPINCEPNLSCLKKRAFSIYNRYNGNFRAPFSHFSNWTTDISVDWVTHGKYWENFCTIPIFRGLSNSKNLSQPSRVNNFQYSRSRRFTERFPRKSSRLTTYASTGCQRPISQNGKFYFRSKQKNRAFSAIILFFSVIFLLDERSCLKHFNYQKITISRKWSVWRCAVTLNSYFPRAVLSAPTCSSGSLKRQLGRNDLIRVNKF